MKTKQLLISVFAVCLALTGAAQLVITEIHYNPLSATVADSIAGGDYFEFFEIKNTSSSSIDISNASFSAGITYTFPANTVLAAYQTIVLCNNIGVFTSFYTGITPFAAFTDGKLSNKGETLLLSKNNVTLIDFTYNDASPWPTAADGLGFSLVLIDETGDINDPANWRASSVKNGTPGTEETEIKIAPIVITEILANTVCPSVDAIELYNPTDSIVDISGWNLTDDIAVPQKFTIPYGTKINAKSILVLYGGTCSGGVLTSNSTQFGDKFSLSSHGDMVYIFSTQNSVLTGYSNGFEFGESELNVSFLRYVNSIGDEFIVASGNNSLGALEYQLQTPNIVFEEINYNADTLGVEYVKITNTTDTAINLTNWDFKGLGFEKDSFTGLILEAGQSFYITEDSIDVAVFRSDKKIAESTPIYQYSGAISNSGETLSIERPGTPYIDGVLTIIPYYQVDIVDFKDSSPWPNKTDGEGAYMIRKDLTAFGSEPTNWKSSAAPVANANLDQIVQLNDVVQLTGEGSYDVNDETLELTYTWQIIEKPVGSAATLANSTTKSPSFVCDVSGKYVITLVVWNGEKINSDTVTVYEYYFFKNQTSTADVELEKSSVYPTVSYGDFFYTISAKAHIIVTDDLGRVVNKFCAEKNGTFSITNPGIYIVTLTSRNNTYKTTIIVK